ncbi:MAG: ATP-binding cassette, subfamily bacterial IrtA/YbtP [Actinomycetota bacterium]|nr:ATP-binding cassette, subfamily bacterial IrtA/YbtP [Actinomycetota bacterium]
MTSPPSTTLQTARSLRQPGHSPGLVDGLRLLLPFARFGAGRYAAAAVLALAGTAAQLLPYWAVYDALRAFVAGRFTTETVARDVVVALVGVVAMAGLLGVSTWMSHRAAFATLEHLRLRIGQRLGEVSLGYLTRRRSGEVQRVLNDDVERLESFLAHAVPDLVSALGVLLGTTAWLVLVDVRMGLVALSVVAVSVPMMIVGVSIGSEKTEAHSRAMSRMNGSVVELIRGIPVVRTFHRGDTVFVETADAIREATGFQAAWGRQLVPVYTAFYTLLTSNVVVIVPAGLWWWTRGTLSTADLLFFLVVGLGYTASVMKLMQLTVQLGRLGLGAALITELDAAPVLPQPQEPAVLGEPAIELDGVRFAHRDFDGRACLALETVTLRVPPRTMTALVGPSGAGKSTLAKLVCRFWDVDSGSVRVSGVDVRNLTHSQLMGQIALVLQETFLFDDTVAANLRLGRPDATDEQVRAAAKAARADEFVQALPEGYGTRIGERGARLSGGERQRLSIARALLKDAPIVVLDEATAFVDPENEAALQDALAELVRGRTLLVVAHRLSTIVGADQIVVLDAGQVVETGRHDDLVAAGGLYARLWAAFEDSGTGRDTDMTRESDDDPARVVSRLVGVTS